MSKHHHHHTRRRSSSSGIDNTSLVDSKEEIKVNLKAKLQARPSKEQIKKLGFFARRKEAKKNQSSSSLTTFTKVLPTDGSVPDLVSQCCRFLLLQGGFVEQGIFRRSGDHGEMAELRSRFERGEDFKLKEEKYDAHVVAGVLKRFFRELDEPLFPSSLYDEMIEAAKEESVDKMIGCFEKLPATNRNCVTLLMPLLLVVSQQAAKNMMSTANLGIVFGPTLMRSPEEMAGGIDLTNNSAQCIRFIIENLTPILEAKKSAPASAPAPAPAPAAPPNLPVITAPSLDQLPPDPVAADPEPAPATPTLDSTPKGRRRKKGKKTRRKKKKTRASIIPPPPTE